MPHPSWGYAANESLRLAAASEPHPDRAAASGDVHPSIGEPFMTCACNASSLMGVRRERIVKTRGCFRASSQISRAAAGGDVRPSVGEPFMACACNASSLMGVRRERTKINNQSTAGAAQYCRLHWLRDSIKSSRFDHRAPTISSPARTSLGAPSSLLTRFSTEEQILLPVN
jgi:hypothetical protein